MMAKFSAGGVQLASDREKLRLLRAERDRDIAALLTPEEWTAYEMRTSISGNIVKSRYGDAIESEAEFQKIHALQKASPWLGMLQNGMAYSTTPPENAPGSLFPGGSQSVYPVMPAGAGPAGAQRQFVINAGAPTDAVFVGDPTIGGSNVRVMTFSAGAVNDSPASGGTIIRQGVVTPAPVAPAPPPSGTPSATPTPGP
ncbi:MAG: hypothetical protein ACREH8_12280 [Opitutaceae bacterium]